MKIKTTILAALLSTQVNASDIHTTIKAIAFDADSPDKAFIIVDDFNVYPNLGQSRGCERVNTFAFDLKKRSDRHAFQSARRLFRTTQPALIQGDGTCTTLYNGLTVENIRLFRVEKTFTNLFSGS